MEDYVAIIVSSMPAFAAFLKSHASDAVFFLSIRSRIRSRLLSRADRSRSRKDIGAKSSSTGSNSYPIPLPNSDYSSYLREGDYFELTENQEIGRYMEGNTKTVLRGAASHGCHEDGDITKAVDVELSSRGRDSV